MIAITHHEIDLKFGHDRRDMQGYSLIFQLFISTSCVHVSGWVTPIKNEVTQSEEKARNSRNQPTIKTNIACSIVACRFGMELDQFLRIVGFHAHNPPISQSILHEEK